MGSGVTLHPAPPLLSFTAPLGISIPSIIKPFSSKVWSGSAKRHRWDRALGSRRRQTVPNVIITITLSRSASSGSHPGLLRLLQVETCILCYCETQQQDHNLPARHPANLLNKLAYKWMNKCIYLYICIYIYLFIYICVQAYINE